MEERVPKPGLEIHNSCWNWNILSDITKLNVLPCSTVVSKVIDGTPESLFTFASVIIVDAHKTQRPPITLLAGSQNATRKACMSVSSSTMVRGIFPPDFC